MATRKQPKTQYIGGMAPAKAAKRPKPGPTRRRRSAPGMPAIGLELPDIFLDLPALDYSLPEIPDIALPDFTLPDINLDIPEMPDIPLPSLDLELPDIFGAPALQRRKRPRRT